MFQAAHLLHKLTVLFSVFTIILNIFFTERSSSRYPVLDGKALFLLEGSDFSYLNWYLYVQDNCVHNTTSEVLHCHTE